MLIPGAGFNNISFPLGVNFVPKGFTPSLTPMDTLYCKKNGGGQQRIFIPRGQSSPLVTTSPLGDKVHPLGQLHL
jgi:hypothetical protein